MFPGGAAARSGLAAGGIVVDGRAVHTVADVQERVSARKAGETVTLSLRRGHEDLQLEVPLMGSREMGDSRNREQPGPTAP